MFGFRAWCEDDLARIDADDLDVLIEAAKDAHAKRSKTG